jgi:pimeloyl-ACP methyl ester carboxylesterase
VGGRATPIVEVAPSSDTDLMFSATLEDDTASRRGERSFASVASHAQVEHIAAAGHLSNLQQPTAFNAAVRHFALDAVAAYSIAPLPGVLE